METYDNGSDALDHRFAPKPRTETSTLQKVALNQQPAFERDFEAATKLREWDCSNEKV